MSPLESGVLTLLGLLVILALGVPIAFALGATAIIALLAIGGLQSLSIVGETFFSGLAEFGLVAIPMFVLMGGVVAASPAGRDVYAALDMWLARVPGSLVLANIGACSVFAALSGSSPATCAAIGKLGIPEMTSRGYPPRIAAGCVAAGGTLGILIPPSVTMIVYGIATETSIGRLFIAGILPGIMLTALFMAWAIIKSRMDGTNVGGDRRFSWREKFAVLPRALPFLLVIAGVLYVLYGGVATPSEASGVAVIFCVILVAVVYRMTNFRAMLKITSLALRESTMIMMIIGASFLFFYALSLMYFPQTLAESIVALDVNRWVLMFLINIFLLVAGFFLPPVAVIVMTAPVLLPIIEGVGFDPYWFAVVLTINMEIGLITPPVGLNLFVIRGIAPQIPLRDILMGALPFVFCMMFGIVLLCVFPGIATWLPEQLMGPAL